MQVTFPLTIMRGGTSRGLFFHERELPVDPETRDRVLLSALGSPDPFGRQIDGLGGATSSTSKVVLVRPSSRYDADVDYTFGQVDVQRSVIDYSGNCGNLSAAVGPFALDEGLTPASAPSATIRLFNTNTKKYIAATFDVCEGKACVEGDYAIDGVPGTAARISLTYFDPGGAVTGKLLPTGTARDAVQIPELGEVAISIIDAANPVVFVEAESLGLTATESPSWMDNQPILLKRLEGIRVAAATALGYSDRIPEALRVALVGPPAAYETTSGTMIPLDTVDLLGRMISLGRAHHAYTLTGAICTAVAARISNTVPYQVSGRSSGQGSDTVRIGHAAGTIEVGVKMDEASATPSVQEVTTFRTARRIMQGYVYVPTARLGSS
jgi:2-methylaconitate cis-trans-isomerase PrpF